MFCCFCPQRAAVFDGNLCGEDARGPSHDSPRTGRRGEAGRAARGCAEEAAGNHLPGNAQGHQSAPAPCVHEGDGDGRWRGEENTHFCGAFALQYLPSGRSTFWQKYLLAVVPFGSIIGITGSALVPSDSNASPHSRYVTISDEKGINPLGALVPLRIQPAQVVNDILHVREDHVPTAETLAILNNDTHEQAPSCHATAVSALVLTYLVRFWGETEASPTPRPQTVREWQTVERGRPQRDPFRPPAIVRAHGHQRQLPPASLPPPPRGVHGEA